MSVKDLLTNDILLSIFDKINIVHRRRIARVCKAWKELVDISFLWVRVFSAVDDRRCVANWQPSHWFGIKFSSHRDYIRVPKVSASDILSKTAEQLPNIRAIDLECCDMNNRIIRTILSHCKKIERINLDSSTRLNFYSFNLMVRDWNRLRHVNLSCCSEVTEVSARFLIQNLPLLESFNLCGTRINGLCLDKLNANMKRLDVSYCWGVQQEGLNALARASCDNLEELSVNNFDFDGSETCMVSLCDKFAKLKHLQLSIGPCVAQEYFIDRVTTRGFSSIARLQQLETLIIEKICILDNTSLLKIMRGCPNLKHLRLNLGWLNFCNNLSFASIPLLLPNLEELHVQYPSALTCSSMVRISDLKSLKALSLVNTDIDNDIFKHIEKMENLRSINFDECRKINLRGLNHLCRSASKRPDHQIKASLLGTGIAMGRRIRGMKNFPPNLIAQISSYRSPKYHLQLPLPVIE